MVLEIVGLKLIQPETIIVVIGVALGITTFSSLLHRTSKSKKQMDELRERMEKHQKAFLAANEANDKKLIAQLEREQTEIMKQLQDNMMASMKPTLLTMPVVLGLLWLMGDWYGKAGPILELPFGLPFLTKATEAMGVMNGMDWFAVYLVTALTSALLIEFVARKLKR